MFVNFVIVMNLFKTNCQGVFCSALWDEHFFFFLEKLVVSCACLLFRTKRYSELSVVKLVLVFSHCNNECQVFSQ